MANGTFDKVRRVFVIPLGKVKNANRKPPAKELAPQLAAAEPSAQAAQPTAEAASLTPPLAAPPAPTTHEFNAQDRGWYAVKFINSDGHKFLGQFAIDQNNVAHWNQVDRAASGAAGFFVGGLSNLEHKYELNEPIGGSDIVFAGIDLIPFAAALKFAKEGKVLVSTGKELSLAGRTRIFAARLIPKSENLKWMGKYAIYGATAYIVVKHPELLTSLFRELASLTGLNPKLVQFLCWFLLVSIALYPLSWVLRLLASSVLFGLSLLTPDRKKRVVRAAPTSQEALTT